LISEQQIEEILAQKSALGAKSLSAEKHQQRAEAARYLSNHQTILELCAGEGSLSEKVYAPLNPRRMVLVDADAQALEKAKIRLAGFGVKKEFHSMRPEQFIKRGFLRRYPDISLVDIDASDSPGPTVQLFFDTYRVRQPMIVALTDGLSVSVKQALGETCMLHDEMMRNLGARRGFRSWRIGRAFEAKSARAIYAAYLLRPVGTRP
jgi:hypothetical protein